jgi:Rho-type GTPase-activating protein 1/2
MDYEGIYRKTGGSGQQKMITQLFERGDYQAFDLLDTERFNDIASVTSVLKNYFRSLPNPLMTYELHDDFVQAITIREQEAKVAATADVVNRLPQEHYHTLRMLMLHLHRVCVQSDRNLMNGRNLGVVFGRERRPLRCEILLVINPLRT